MPIIGILCPTEKELAPFLPHIQQVKTTQKALLTIYTGSIGTVPVAAVFCGVCKTNAAIAAQILIDTCHVDAIINAGTAGGMDEELAIFDTVIATETAHHDVAAEILTEYHPWLPTPFFPSDRQLLALAEKAAEAIHKADSTRALRFGRMVTGESFITDNGRADINAAYAPLSVDMETASIAQVCYANATPFLAVRTITDTATHSGTATFEENCAIAAAFTCDLVVALLAEMA